MGYSQKNRSAFVMDIAIGSVWLLLIAHESVSDWLVAPFLILYPVLRIWTSFLLHRRSGLVVTPIMLLSLLTIVALVDTALSYTLFIEPWITLINTASAAFDLNARDITGSSIAVIGDYRCTIPVGLISSIWLIGLPWTMCVYARVKTRFFPSRLGSWESLGLCIFILGIVVLDVIILYHSENATLGVALQALMVLLIPIIFYRGSVKNLFSRSEVAYLLTIALFAIGYVCGIGLELKSVVTVCLLPAAFYALANWYVRRETTYRDMLLVVGASIVFWCAQYTTNMARVLLLLVSLALMAVTVVRFAIDTKKNWASAGLYVMIALIMPVFCLGYNPYSVWEASRAWHFDKYYGSPDGILCVRAGDTGGLRDRYGVILPLEYDRIELLTPSKPYCKVRKDGKWQIYDIERQELVSDEWFEDVIPYDEYVYRLKSQNGDKYLTMHWYYSRYEEQTAKIVDGKPVKKEELEIEL